MGTRGLWGFYYKKKDKLTYNHFDSYPTGLGQTIKEFIGSHSIQELKKIASKIRVVDGDNTPTPAQIRECNKFTNLSVSKQNIKEWYCLLRDSQGEPESYVKGKLRYMIDSKAFIKDSLFCEYAYIINLDTKKLEIYLGFQKKPQDNRYKMTKKEIQKLEEKHKEDKLTLYYNCKLWLEVPLKEVKDLNIKKLEKDLNKEEEEEL